MAFLSELKKWSRAYNLTALKTDEDIIIKHFLDSLLYLKAIDLIVPLTPTLSPTLRERGELLKVLSHKGRGDFLTFPPPLMGGGEGEGESSYSLKIADVGTGAGFPGIPIKIIKPEIEITLIEPSRKKAAFLRHIIRVLKLNNIHVLEQRLENLGRAYEKTYDVILSRAVFKIKDFLKKACPYVKENGILILSKGPKVSEEIKGVNAIKKILKLELPFVKAQRNLLILRC
ncbi:MAG: 16S rRNA (guanine(527)-N(7))-methyltransferase RsmG [Candidatus Roizmanbacteria bacterium]|nr:16S rRNA (guanine(527)-N(7))-methyltransferase RsmG [Candidatus Roizmanbacteria bacterium]